MKKSVSMKTIEREEASARASWDGASSYTRAILVRTAPVFDIYLAVLACSRRRRATNIMPPRSGSMSGGSLSIKAAGKLAACWQLL